MRDEGCSKFFIIIIMYLHIILMIIIMFVQSFVVCGVIISVRRELKLILNA